MVFVPIPDGPLRPDLAARTVLSVELHQLGHAVIKLALTIANRGLT